MSIDQLILHCRDGDRRAQEQLYTDYAPKLYGICLRYGKDTDGANEILQRSFIKIFKSLHSFKGEGSFEGWAKKIVVNMGIESYREQQRSLSVLSPLEVSETDGPSVSWDELDAKDLLRLISELPEGFRMVFNLYAIEGYSHKEIGELLSISEGTSKSQLSRARQLLKNKLASMEGGVYASRAR